MEDTKYNIKIILKAIEAKDLLSADLNGLSDPYLLIPSGQQGVVDLPKKKNRTKRIDKTLNPIWNEIFIIELDPLKCKKLKIEVYDYDYIGSDDFLGEGYVTLEWINLSENYNEEWIPLKIEKINKKTKQKEVTRKGSVHIKIRVLGFLNLANDEEKPFQLKDEMPQEILKSINIHKTGDALEPGTWIIITEPEVFVGLGWDFTSDDIIDLDASVTGFDHNIELIEYVYFYKNVALNESLVHFGDNRNGKGWGDDEIIQIFLNKVPSKVGYLTVTVNSYHGDSLIKAKSAFVRLYTKKEKIGKYLLNRTKDCVGLLLGVFQKDIKLNIWYFRVMADPIEGVKIAESIGSIKKLLGNYSLNVGSNSNYINNFLRHPYPGEALFDIGKWIKVKTAFVYVGLGWNLQNDFNFDLDASILTFDENNNLLEIIYHQNLQSKNGAIVHKGDNKTGEGEGDNEILSIEFNKLEKNVFTLAVIINSFKGNSLINILDGFIRLYDNDRPIGVNILENCPDCVGLFMGIFRRKDKKWYFQAIKEPIKGTIAKESVNDVQKLLDKYKLD